MTIAVPPLAIFAATALSIALTAGLGLGLWLLLARVEGLALFGATGSRWSECTAPPAVRLRRPVRDRHRTARDPSLPRCVRTRHAARVDDLRPDRRGPCASCDRATAARSSGPRRRARVERRPLDRRDGCVRGDNAAVYAVASRALPAFLGRRLWTLDCRWSPWRWQIWRSPRASDPSCSSSVARRAMRSLASPDSSHTPRSCSSRSMLCAHCVARSSRPRRRAGQCRWSSA